VKRSCEAISLEAGIELVGGITRGRIRDDDRVERGPGSLLTMVTS
jgi:hypothetical protein